MPARDTLMVHLGKGHHMSASTIITHRRGLLIGAGAAIIALPFASVFMEPLLAVVPLHIFGMELAAAKGLDIDQPRNLAKSVTVE